MEGSKSLVNLGELSKPATVLIEKVSDAIGGIFKPWQIRRIAQAEAEAEKIKALSKIEISGLTNRALGRFLGEETMKQANIEEIVLKALPGVLSDSNPEQMSNDWIVNFFDKCRLISDDDMQMLWARILAGESNNPGKFSKRTIDFLSSIDKDEAELFTRLCSYILVDQDGELFPIIDDVQSTIYTVRGITFTVLKHLDDIGLIAFDSLAGYRRMELPKIYIMDYYGARIQILFKRDEGNEIRVGKVLLSKVGVELFPIVGSKPVPGFLDYILETWQGMGLNAMILKSNNHK